MIYYYAQNHNIDSATVNKFIENCPEGYTVKSDCYKIIERTSQRHGKWFYYFYEKKGEEIDKYRIDLFFMSLYYTLGRIAQLLDENSDHRKIIEQKNSLLLKGSLGFMDKTSLKFDEAAVISVEDSLSTNTEILDNKYDDVWNHIAGFCTPVSYTDGKKDCYRILSAYDSNELRSSLYQRLFRPTEIYGVRDLNTCLFYIQYYCFVNHIVFTNEILQEAKKRVVNKDKRTSYGTIAFLLLEDIKRGRLSARKTSTNTASSTQARALNFCPKCGAKINASDSFCPTCGRRIE